MLGGLGWALPEPRVGTASPTRQENMVQLDCGLVRTEGLAPRSTEGRDCTEGRVCVGGKGFWMVDGAEGSGSDGRVFGRLTEWKDLGWMKGFFW
jgi:hypothetical protein